MVDDSRMRRQAGGMNTLPLWLLGFLVAGLLAARGAWLVLIALCMALDEEAAR